MVEMFDRIKILFFGAKMHKVDIFQVGQNDIVLDKEQSYDDGQGHGGRSLVGFELNGNSLDIEKLEGFLRDIELWKDRKSVV